MSIIDRQLVGERPDTGAGFVFPIRATCDFENDGWGCSFDEVFYTRKAAQWAAENHEHFKTYQQRRYNYLSIAEFYWIELDGVTDKLKEFAANFPTGPTDVENGKEFFKLQGRASGLAFAIVRACTPYYADERAVSVEANRRWKMRNGQLDWAPTLGFKYSPPPAGRRELQSVQDIGHESPVRVNTKRTAVDPREAKAAKLKASDRDAIKRGLESGMFKAADLAKVYGVTEDIVLFVASA